MSGPKGTHDKPISHYSLELDSNLDPAIRGVHEFKVEGLMFKISHGALTDPNVPFLVGDTITGGTSTETGTVVHVGTGFLIYRQASAGPLQNAEVLTGTGGGEATSSSVPAAEPHRILLNLRKLMASGFFNVCRIDQISVSGAVYTQFIIDVMDTDDVGALVNSQNTMFRAINISPPAAPETKIVHQTNISRDFVTEGTAGIIQLAVTPTGGDFNTSDQTWRIRCYGRKKT